MKTLVLSVALLALAAPAAAGEWNTGYFGNVAIEGYDTVAYFTEGEARRGSAEFATEFGGAEWHFASAANRDKFVADPEAYAPQFGGLCTEGVAFKEISVNLTPEVFQIVDGKLYLNYSTYWMDLPGNLPKSEANWPEVKALLEQ
jgi:YHS domain-containing protein